MIPKTAFKNEEVKDKSCLVDDLTHIREGAHIMLSSALSPLLFYFSNSVPPGSTVVLTLIPAAGSKGNIEYLILFLCHVCLPVLVVGKCDRVLIKVY